MIRFALLGTWHVHAIHHLQDCMSSPDAEIVVVWDSHIERGQAFASAHGLAFEPDLAKVLGQGDIVGVVVDTATADHPKIIGAALDAGKHVFVEKVLALETADAQALVHKARENGLTLRVSLQRLIEAPVRTVIKLVNDGAIGRVTGSRIRYAHRGAVGTPLIPRHFFDPDEAGGGAIVDLGAHGFYLGMALHGTWPIQIQTVATQVTAIGVEDNTASILTYPNGAISVAETSFVSGFFGYAIEVNGVDGAIVLGPTDQRVLLRHTGDADWVSQPLVLALPPTLHQFIAILNGAPDDPQHLETAIWLTRLCQGAYRSVADKKVVALAE